MEITVCVDVMGTDVEFDYEVDDVYIHEYVTNGDDADWAREHFEQEGDVNEFVEEYLSNLTAEDLTKLVAPMLGIT